MKPNKFILNSDYLSIAQTGTSSHTVYVGGGTLQPGGYTDQDFNFTIKSEKGAIDRILISKDGGNYILGSFMTIFPAVGLDPLDSIEGFLQVYRSSPSNLLAKLVLENHSGNVMSYPSMTFTIKVSSFKPPNVF